MVMSRVIVRIDLDGSLEFANRCCGRTLAGEDTPDAIVGNGVGRVSSTAERKRASASCVLRCSRRAMPSCRYRSAEAGAFPSSPVGRWEPERGAIRKRKTRQETSLGLPVALPDRLDLPGAVTDMDGSLERRSLRPRMDWSEPRSRSLTSPLREEAGAGGGWRVSRGLHLGILRISQIARRPASCPLFDDKCGQAGNTV